MQRSLNRPLGAVLALLVLMPIAACTSPPSDDPTAPSQDDSAPQTQEDPVAAAADLLQARYELVRDGDYAAVCELYSPGFIELFAALAEADPSDCVAAHEAAAENVAEYLATAEAQGRAGLTPFFYVPSEIEIDPSKITSDDPAEAIAQSGAVVSLDDREFEDGAGKTPGWLSGLVYVGDIDGAWRFMAPGEG
jgi:hypothetical protein